MAKGPRVDQINRSALRRLLESTKQQWDKRSTDALSQSLLLYARTVMDIVNRYVVVHYTQLYGTTPRFEVSPTVLHTALMSAGIDAPKQAAIPDQKLWLMSRNAQQHLFRLSYVATQRELAKLVGNTGRRKVLATKSTLHPESVAWVASFLTGAASHLVGQLAKREGHAGHFTPALVEAEFDALCNRLFPARCRNRKAITGKLQKE